MERLTQVFKQTELAELLQETIPAANQYESARSADDQPSKTHKGSTREAQAAIEHLIWEIQKCYVIT
jgi:hypothetical protein